MDRTFSRRRLLQSGLAATVGLSALGAVGCGSDDGGGATAKAADPKITPKIDGDLTWFTWDGDVDPAVVTAFEKEYGVKVELTFFDSNEAMIQKLAAGLPYDVITSNSAYQTRMTQGKLIQTFDPGQLKNWGELDAYFKKPVYDTGEARYSVPYGYSPTGFVYDKSKIGTLPTRKWDALWQTDQTANKHLYLLDYIDDAIGASIIRNGGEAKTGDPAVVAKAVDELLKLKPHLGGLSTSLDTVIPTGDLWISQCWAGQAWRGIQESKNPEDWEVVLPDDGALIGVDLLTIGAKAKSPGTAMLFLDWTLRPEMAAKNTVAQGQMIGTTASTEKYDEITKDYPYMQFGADVLKKVTWREALTGQRQQVWAQQWSRFKAS